MTLANLLSVPCTITHHATSGQLDGYGDEKTTTTSTQTVCELQQAARSEDTDRGDIARTGWRLFLPPGTAIAAKDTVLVGGVTFEVDGEPWHARSPRRRVASHVEATLTRVAGDDDPAPAP